MNVQDRKDLEKYTKFFIFKAVQTIVQSRLGERLKTRSKETCTGSEWFNLAIADIQDVQIEIKKALDGLRILPHPPICVEISLKTSENEWMIMETWCIEWDANACDENVRVHYSVYNRMSILLKSLTCITRLVPAYRISRQQSPDAYLMCYRVYVGDPQVQHLGDNFATKRIGQVATPSGSLSLTVAYRTRMLFAAAGANDTLAAAPPFSTNTSSSTLITMNAKEDHYATTTTTTNHGDSGPARRSARVSSSGMVDHHYCMRRQNSAEARGPPDEDLCDTILFSTSPMGPDPTFDHTPTRHLQGGVASSSVASATAPNSQPRQQQQQHNAQDSPGIATKRAHGAFAPSPSSRPNSSGNGAGRSSSGKNNHNDAESEVDGIIPDTPFPVMFHLSLDEEFNEAKSEAEETDNDDIIEGEDQMPSPSPRRRRPFSSAAADDPEFVLVELRPPFAESDAKCDVGAFYRDCQNAPQLACFDDKACNLETTVAAIADRLTFYDEAQADLDKFVDDLPVSEESDSSEPEHV